MAEEIDRILHANLFVAGMFFFFVGTLTGYYMVFVQNPASALTELIIAAHVHLLHMGYLLSLSALIIPAAGFRSSIIRFLAYILTFSAVLFVGGFYLLAGGFEFWFYLLEVFGPLLIIGTTITFSGYLGFGGKRVSRWQMDRFAMMFLAFMFLTSMIFGLWMATIAAAEQTVLIDLVALHTHAMHYSIWAVIAAVIMKASKPNERFYKLIIFGFIAASILWSITFAVYISGIPIQMASGGMDAILGIAVLSTLLSLWGLFGKRGKITPYFALGSISLAWVIVAGGIGLYLGANYAGVGLPVPHTWRLLHSINAEWAMASGIGALGLMAARSVNKLGWIVVIAFSGGMIKSLVGYTLLVQESPIADTLLRIGEPSMSLAFLLTAYIVFTSMNLQKK